MPLEPLATFGISRKITPKISKKLIFWQNFHGFLHIFALIELILGNLLQPLNRTPKVIQKSSKVILIMLSID